MYVAATSRLYTNLLQPGHEALGLPTEQSSMYTPYLVFVAWVGRLAEVSPYRALEWAGFGNLICYVFGVHYFFSRHSLHYRFRLSAACFLWVSLGLRAEHFGWSSETSLLSFAFVQAYPSTLGWSLALVAFGLVEELRRQRKNTTLLALTLILGLLVSCHTLTASWTMGTLWVYALHARCMRESRGLVPRLLAASLMALALAELWPYGSLLGHLTNAGVSEPSNFGAQPFQDFWTLYLLFVPIAVWVAYRLRSHLVWILCLVASYAALLIWRAMEVSFGNRYSFFMAFFAQFLLAEVLAIAILLALRAQVSLKVLLSARRPDKLLLVSLLPAALIMLLISPVWRQAFDPSSPARLQSPSALLAQASPHDAYYHSYPELRARLRSEDLIMMPTSRVAFDLAALTGARFVSAPGAIRADDVVERFRAATLFFRPGVSVAARAMLLARYRVTHVLVPANHAGLLPELARQLGRPLFRNAQFTLFDASRWRGAAG